MNKYHSLILVVFFAVVFAAFFRDYSATATIPDAYEPLEGTLFKGHIEALEKAEVAMPKPELPRVPVYLASVQSIGLPPDGKAFIAELVPLERARARVVSSLDTAARTQKATPTRQAQTPAEPLLAPAQQIPVTGSFGHYDALLNESPSTFALRGRAIKGGVGFQLMQIGRSHTDFLLKVAIVNEEDADFFVSAVDLIADGQILRSQTYLPFSCPPGETVYGIVKFAASDSAGKKVSVKLAEGGDRHRAFEIKIVDDVFARKT